MFGLRRRLAAGWPAGEGDWPEVWRRARFVLPLVLLAAVFVPLVREGGAGNTTWDH